MNIETPRRWRKGQTIFNFLWWLNEHKGFHREMGTFGVFMESTEVGGRMADPFHIEDSEIDSLFREYLEHVESN